MPGVEMTLYALSSLFVAFMIVEKGPKEGIILYAASVLLGLILVPNKLGLLPFIAFFGYYGVLKYYIERLRKLPVQLIVKIIFYALIMLAAMTLGSELLFGSRGIPEVPYVIFYIGGILMMVLYDWIYTLAIKIYRQRFKREKTPEFKLYNENEDEEKQ